jgi:cell division protein FtsL
MNVAYLLTALVVVLVVAVLIYTTAYQEDVSKEIDSLGSDIDLTGQMLDDFSALDNLGLSEINDSLFNP